MSFEAVRWAQKQRVRGATLKGVLVAVACYANDDGFAWPSQARLARDCGVSTRSVIRALAALERADLLEVRRRPPRADGKRETNLLRLKRKPSDIASLGIAGNHVTACPEPSDTLTHKSLGNHQPYSSQEETQVFTGRGYTRGRRRRVVTMPAMPHEDEPF